jgi:hypothetical protein
MEFSKEKIYETAVNIMNDADKLNSQELEQKYMWFKENFFKLYDTCSTIMPNEREKTLLDLKVLLNIRDNRKAGIVSNVESNVQVTEYMAKQYIYPITGEPTKEQKKDAIRKIIQADKNAK